MVAPDLAGRGLGSWLLNVVEGFAPHDVHRLVLFTGGRSQRNISTYERAGYRLTELPTPIPTGHIHGAVFMVKDRSGGRRH